MERVRAGDRFITTEDIEVIGLTHWEAPFTGGFEAVLPRGIVLEAPNDAVEGAEGFGCTPERYDEIEAALVPEQDRLAENYAGYSFSVLRSDIGTKLRRL